MAGVQEDTGTPLQPILRWSPLPGHPRYLPGKGILQHQQHSRTQHEDVPLSLCADPSPQRHRCVLGQEQGRGLVRSGCLQDNWRQPLSRRARINPSQIQLGFFLPSSLRDNEAR